MEKSHRRSGLGRYSSFKNSSVGGGLDKSFNEDNVPDEENKIKEMMFLLRSKCFISKPGFSMYDTGDQDLSRCKIAQFPKFRNIFAKNKAKASS